MNRKLTYSVGILFFLVGASVWAFPWGPPDAKTGAPGEGTCAQCHGNLNTGSGSAMIIAPSDYSPDDTIDVSVAVQQTGQMRWGFEITALDSTNQPVGNFIVTDPSRTQLSIAGTGRQYLKHTLAGTDSGVPDVAPGWTLRWAAPQGGAGQVTFYAACNAANGNDKETGDFIYTNSKTVVQSICLAIPGDVNASGAITLGDIVHLVNYVFDKDKFPCLGIDPGNCWTPDPFCRGDVNQTGTITLGDIIHLVNYIFDKDRLPCLGSDPGNCWTPEANGACCLPVP